jgi:HEAT repeat protein
MIAQLREKRAEFDRRGVHVLVVDVLPRHVVRYIARRAKAAGEAAPARPIDRYVDGYGRWLTDAGEMGLTVVTDPAAAAGASYGVAFGQTLGALGTGELCNQPACFLIDRDGVVRFVQQYKDTSELGADALLQIFDDLEEKRRHVEQLIERSSATDPLLAEAAARSLIAPSDGARDAALLLEAALRGGDPEVRAAAAAALCFLGYRAQSAVPSLAQALRDGDARVRRWSAETLARVGPAAKAAVGELVQALIAADGEVRDAFDRSLRDSSPRAEIIFPPYVAEIRLQDEPLRMRALLIAALERIGAAAVPALVETLRSADARARLNAAEVLGRFVPQAAEAAPELARALRDDPEARVRAAATNALERLGQYDRALLAALRDEDSGVRAAAAYALERTGGLAHWDGVLGLVDALDDSDQGVREAAYYALDHRADESVPTMIAALKSEDARERERAARVIAQLALLAAQEPDGRLASGFLEHEIVVAAARADEDAGVRAGVLEALQAIAALKTAAESPQREK